MTNYTDVGPLYGLTFAYDAKGRRIQKVATTNGTSFTTLNCLYDGWNLVAILNSPSSIIESFTWGNDLSGSQQGAGGVGGLLEETYYGTATTNCFAAYDGNGNIAELVSAADGTAVANYEFGPFGEVIRSTGPMAKVNPFRFSTKYQDDESDLLYYGYRYYKPSTGTWVRRDPVEEDGGVNLYTFANNVPVAGIDFLGLDCGDGNLCGCDVTQATARTLDNIEAIFNLWDASTAFKSCKKIISPSHGLKSWDIEELHIGDKPPSGCGRTVTFNKSCHYRSGVNYAMYGKMCSLCSERFGQFTYISNPTGALDPWTLAKALAYVAYYKEFDTKAGLNAEALDAFPFVVYGYTGQKPMFGALGINCGVNSAVAKNYAFHWHWVPGKMNVAPPQGYKLKCPN